MNGDAQADIGLAELSITEPLLSVRRLCKDFPGPESRSRRPAPPLRAADQVTFDVAPGETLGLAGESGSGKTTVARCILRALRPTSGAAWLRLPGGREVNLAAASDSDLKPIRREMQMIFQDPVSSLNPRMTVREIVAEPLVVHRIARGADLDDHVAAALRRVGLSPEHGGRYPHAFSGGQRQRIAIARALILRPSLIVCDEATSALDVLAQAQVLDLLKELQSEFGLTYLFITHDLDIVRGFCDRVAVMRHGRIVELAPTRQLFEDPRHPYTRLLLSATPPADSYAPDFGDGAELLRPFSTNGAK